MCYLTSMNNEKQSIPNPNNFCGGNFQDWLEVNLTDHCNAKCSWCVEKKGWHPSYHAPWTAIVDAAIASAKTNIILLGGEPTLHPDFRKIIKHISDQGQLVWVTTNGSQLNHGWVIENMRDVHGVNISIHSRNLYDNSEITGLKLDSWDLRDAIQELHALGVTVRFNCNCISGYVDSEEEISEYVLWAKEMGANKVRFSELKNDDDSFVDLAKILNYKYGLNDNPFTCGCNKDTEIHGMPVNFRQMCGLQTPKRTKPINPLQHEKKVLYYDGKVYDGWKLKKEGNMDKKKLRKIIEKVQKFEMSVEEATDVIQKDRDEEIELASTMAPASESGSGCAY